MRLEQKEFNIGKKPCFGIAIELPNTNVFIVGNDEAYFMCGILNVGLFNKPPFLEKKVVCGKAVGVSSIEDLLNAPLVEVSEEAKNKGILCGMCVKDALGLENEQ